jgi:ArsR family transcriptional regulator, lead/cadmium/zinc/bismuth-responsive transcriptional repressor
MPNSNLRHAPASPAVRSGAVSADPRTPDPELDAGKPDGCEIVHVKPGTVDSIRPKLVDQRAAAALAATFSVLGDPTRVRLLDALAQSELCVCELSELVGSSESAVSHQLRLLRSLRLVRSRRSGRLVFYTLDDGHIRSLLEQGRRHIEEDVHVSPETTALRTPVRAPSPQPSLGIE